MLPATDKEENKRDYLKLAQIHTIIHRREHEERRKMVIKNILQKQGDINYKIPETHYLNTFKPNLIDCSALHLAFDVHHVDIFNEILQHGADFMIEYHDLTIIHRAVEENFDKREIEKNEKRFKQYYQANFTSQDIHSFILMSKVIEQKNVNECDNWRLRSQLDDQFIQAIFSAQIQHNNPANPRSKNGISHLHAACMDNNCKAVKFFLENGADVNETVNADSPIYSGCASIHFAVRCSGLETVRELLKYKVNVNDQDGQGKTPLQILIDHNIKIREWLIMMKKLPYENALTDYVKNEKIINLLIDNSESVNNVDSLYLYGACTLKSATTAETLLKKITNINEPIDLDSSVWPGYTALHFAALFNVEIVKLLLKHGADIKAKDKNGVTALDILATRANIKDLHFILSTNDEWRNIVLSDGKTRLLDLISSTENPSSFDSFLNTINVNAFVPVDSPLWPGYTILHLAVMLSETAIIQQFFNNIDDGAEINYKQQLEKCCREQEEVHHERILVCLRRNANVNMRDVHGRTPIHLAFRQRKMNVVNILLQHVKNLENLPDEDNLSLLHISCAAECKELVEKLIPCIDMPILPTFKWDSNFDSCDVFKIVGSTPLHLAVSQENVDIVKLLVSGGADVNAKDADKLTAIHRIYALENIWDMGEEMFNWSLSTNNMRNMMLFESPELDRYYYAKGNLKDIKYTLLSSPTSKETIDSSFSIHQIPSYGKNHPNYSLVSHELFLQREAGKLAKQANGSDRLFNKLKYPYLDDIPFIIEILQQDENIANRLRAEFGWTTLHVASLLFNAQLAQESLNEGIDVNAFTSKDSPIHPSCTALHILMMRLGGNRIHFEYDFQYQPVLRILLDNGADVTLTDVNNDTPLHRSNYTYKWLSSIFKDSIDSNLLLDNIKRFEFNPIDSRGISLFHVACIKQNPRAIKKFLKHGVDVNQPVDFFSYDDTCTDAYIGCTALHMVIKELPQSSDIDLILDIVELLLKHGANINSVDVFGNTPLHIAAEAKAPSEKLFEYLIRNGADVHVENVYGKKPFEVFLYERRNTLKEIEFFMKHGCRLNTFNPLSEVGYIALMIRNRRGEERRIALDMAMNCPSINEIDDLGRTAMHNIVAINDFNDEDYNPIEYFMRYGGDIDHQDRLGRTALHMAAQFRSRVAVGSLLSAGADINIVDANGKTAFAYTLDPETDLVNQTLTFNVSVNKHLVIMVFAKNVYNMQLRGLYIHENNKQALSEADDCQEELNEISNSFEKVRNEKIGSTSMKLEDFMCETGAVVTYPKKSLVERKEIDTFFTITAKEDRFREWQFLCKLQYRKSLARGQLVEQAKDAMNVIIDFPLPYLCFDAIQQFLPNEDLKNLIGAAALK